jgi:hypothetical protein
VGTRRERSRRGAQAERLGDNSRPHPDFVDQDERREHSVLRGDQGAQHRLVRHGRAKVTYEYDVEGHTYTGTKVGVPPQRRQWGRHSSRGRGIDWNLALYEKGASIPVHYDPANPSDAILHKAEGSGCAMIMLFIVGSIFIGIGLLAWTVIRSLP